MSSPPVMYQNLIMVGDHVQEGNGPGVAGDVRAYDIHDGKLAWTFHSIPRPGEKNFGTWAGDSWKQRSGVNVWGFMTVDVARGIVYMPFGAPSGDLWGGDRPGNDLYDTCVRSAVDAKTGKYLWHFQVVHHDIWDFDPESPPVLDGYQTEWQGDSFRSRFFSGKAHCFSCWIGPTASRSMT